MNVITVCCGGVVENVVDPSGINNIGIFRLKMLRVAAGQVLDKTHACFLLKLLLAQTLKGTYRLCQPFHALTWCTGAVGS
jgi:hypothetical protein